MCSIYQLRRFAFIEQTDNILYQFYMQLRLDFIYQQDFIILDDIQNRQHHTE